jgi:hypothetical protein
MTHKKFTVQVMINMGATTMWSYQDSDPLYCVGQFTVVGTDERDAAGAMWSVGQKEWGPDEDGRWYPREVRSLCMGDVLEITDPQGRQSWWAFLAVGFAQVTKPTKVTSNVRVAQRLGHVRAGDDVQLKPEVDT